MHEKILGREPMGVLFSQNPVGLRRVHLVVGRRCLMSLLVSAPVKLRPLRDLVSKKYVANCQHGVLVEHVANESSHSAICTSSLVLECFHYPQPATKGKV